MSGVHRKYPLTELEEGDVYRRVHRGKGTHIDGAITGPPPERVVLPLGLNRLIRREPGKCCNFPVSCQGTREQVKLTVDQPPRAQSSWRKMKGGPGRTKASMHDLSVPLFLHLQNCGDNTYTIILLSELNE